MYIANTNKSNFLRWTNIFMQMTSTSKKKLNRIQTPFKSKMRKFRVEIFSPLNDIVFQTNSFKINLQKYNLQVMIFLRWNRIKIQSRTKIIPCLSILSYATKAHVCTHVKIAEGCLFRFINTRFQIREDLCTFMVEENKQNQKEKCMTINTKTSITEKRKCFSDYEDIFLYSVLYPKLSHLFLTKNIP